MKYIAFAAMLALGSSAFANGYERQEMTENDCTGINRPIWTLNADGTHTAVLPNTNIRWCGLPGLSVQEDPAFKPDGGGDSGGD